MPCRLKKRCYACGRNPVLHPLVASGNPPHRPKARTTAHPARIHHRMVVLAPRPPSRSTPCSYQEEKATVMLVSFDSEIRQKRYIGTMRISEIGTLDATLSRV